MTGLATDSLDTSAVAEPARHEGAGPFAQRAVSSAVEHTLHTRGVTGSIPVPPTSLPHLRRWGADDPCTVPSSRSVIDQLRRLWLAEFHLARHTLGSVPDKA